MQAQPEFRFTSDLRTGIQALDRQHVEWFQALEALRKAVGELSPEQIIDQVDRSGLRGRGGAGFPTGRKWKAVRAAAGPLKYVVCNGDEGDPGAFMDRAVIEGDPHRVLEGMAVAAYAIGATKAYVYIRAEYPLAIQRLVKLGVEIVYPEFVEIAQHQPQSAFPNPFRPGFPGFFQGHHFFVVFRR